MRSEYSAHVELEIVRSERNVDDVDSLELSGVQIHRESRRGVQNRVVPFGAESTYQQIDGLVCATGEQQPITGNPIEIGEGVQQIFGLTFRISIQLELSCVPGVRRVGAFVRIEAYSHRDLRSLGTCRA